MPHQRGCAHIDCRLGYGGGVASLAAAETSLGGLERLSRGRAVHGYERAVGLSAARSECLRTRAREFYGDLSIRIVVGGLLSLISIAVFVAAASGLRSVLIELEQDRLLPDIAYGGILLGLAGPDRRGVGQLGGCPEGR
jgi:hypothetical protein